MSHANTFATCDVSAPLIWPASNTIWKSAGDGAVRDYDFTYDAANRLTNADFTQFTGGYFNKSAGIDFSMNAVTYDANGNIKTMQQKGWKANASAVIDNLSYTYLNNSTSNKLARVTDAATDPNTKLGDFKDGTNAGMDDYSYDVNGNMTVDNNKAISSIAYTHLNTPYQVTITGKGTITYLYNNLGEKLKKTIVDSTTTPAIILHIQHFVQNKKSILIINKNDNTIGYNDSKMNVVFNFDEITLFNYVASYGGGKSAAGYYSFGDYRFCEIAFKDNTEIIITCLMVHDLQNTLEMLLGIKAEKKPKIFPFITKRFSSLSANS